MLLPNSDCTEQCQSRGKVWIKGAKPRWSGYFVGFKAPRFICLSLRSLQQEEKTHINILVFAKSDEWTANQVSCTDACWQREVAGFGTRWFDQLTNPFSPPQWRTNFLFSLSFPMFHVLPRYSIFHRPLKSVKHLKKNVRCNASRNDLIMLKNILGWCHL